MAYIIGEIESVKRKVEFKLLADDGKPVKKADMIVTFKVRTAEENRERMLSLQKFTAERSRQLALLRTNPAHELNLEEVDFDADFLREDITDIAGIMDTDGNDIEFSKEVLESVLQDRQAKKALIETWSELNLDGDGGKRKN